MLKNLKSQKKSKKPSKKAAAIKFIILVLALGIATYLLWGPANQILESVTRFKEFVLGYGIFAPLVYIGIAILQVIIAPIPGQAVGIFGGYTFGLFPGFLFGAIGMIAGTTITFSLSKKFGRPFVESIISPKALKKFDKISGKKGLFTIFMLYLVPFFPDDIMSFLFGMTSIRIGTFIVVSTLGRLPGLFVLSLIGNKLSGDISVLTWIVLATTTLISVIAYLNKDLLEKKVMSWFFKRHRKKGKKPVKPR